MQLISVWFPVFSLFWMLTLYLIGHQLRHLCLSPHHTSHKWPRIGFVCRNHNPVHSSFMTYHKVCNKSSMTGATSREGTAHSSEPTVITLHLFGWNLSSHLSDHSCKLSRSFCRLVVSVWVLIYRKSHRNKLYQGRSRCGYSGGEPASTDDLT
jgi:hypothetical protein